MTKTHNFEDHIILYAKGWYGKSGNGIIHDLSMLLSKYANIEGQHISKRDVIEPLIHTFVRTTSDNHYDLFDALREMILPSFPFDSKYNRSAESMMIGKISVWSPDENWGLSFEDLKAGKGLLDIRLNKSDIT